MQKVQEESNDEVPKGIRSANLFPVVGIGASAGGLKAFTKFLEAIPEESGMAYIIVQHLDPSHESILPELLQRATKLPVLEITDNVLVEPDHVYIIPSNRLLTATDGVLQLSARPNEHQKNMPIDIFFSSLAEVHQNHAIGIVLSGTGSDGTMGLQAIKDHGGITFAQEPVSASHEGMPQSAIDTDMIDFILPPEKMPAQLITLNLAFKNGAEMETRQTGAVAEDDFRQVIALLHASKGMDFSHYKQTTIRRRIIRRIALNMLSTITDYCDFLAGNKTELETLYKDLLIAVTQFFRDPAVFDVLQNSVFPALLKGKPANEPLRIWVAGCSTGQEAYSIIMCLHEHLGAKATNTKIQLFATDISDASIAKARSGIYRKNEVAGLSPARLHRFFTQVDGKFQLNKVIREACIFANHNLLKDPPFAKMDLVSCRNVLIYMEPVLQKKAFTIFHYALKENGFLLLGKSEATTQVTDMYNVFDKVSKVYTRKTIAGRLLHWVTKDKDESIKGNTYGVIRKEKNKDDFQRNADDVLLAKYAPPGVVVNDDLDIVQFRGATSMWLAQPHGKPSLNLLKMAREGLSFELRNALRSVKASKQTFSKADIPITFLGKEHLVTLEVIPLLNIPEPHFLVLFHDVSLPSDPAADAAAKLSAHHASRESRQQARIKELLTELGAMREDMKNFTEEQEATNLELQSTNEELLSGSEELQSLNEELETSREEIQTSNEELIIVNQELYERNEQLNQSRLYAESIVTTIREPLLVLNKDMVVKSANRAFYEKFQTSPDATEGKSLFELGNKQWDIPMLRDLLEKLLPEKTSIVDHELTSDFPGLGKRVMLLNASGILLNDAGAQSILLAVEDITEQTETAKALKISTDDLERQVRDRTRSLFEANADLRNSNENLAQFAYIASHDLQEPLRKIRTFSTLLQDTYSQDLPVAARSLLGKILRSSERMSTLISDVLNFSTILHGDIAFESVDLNDVLSETIEDFDLLITEKDAVIQKHQLQVIEAVRLQIKQLFYNLLSNALKFSRKDVTPVISITSRILPAGEVQANDALDPKLTYCEICFKDNGIGFQQEYAERIFLIFRRLHSLEQFSGTGIGLALCKKIVVNHHGEIYASSKAGAETVFGVILPLTQHRRTQ